MTFLNVINFGDQGECGDAVGQRQDFLAAPCGLFLKILETV